MQAVTLTTSLTTTSCLFHSFLPALLFTSNLSFFHSFFLPSSLPSFLPSIRFRRLYAPTSLKKNYLSWPSSPVFIFLPAHTQSNIISSFFLFNPSLFGDSGRFILLLANLAKVRNFHSFFPSYNIFSSRNE